MSKRKLLLADDSVTIQKVVNLTFADEGIEVIAVGDGDSAMDKLAEISPDLVMADVNMPGLNGYQICEQIKQDELLRETPVILLVGSFEPFDEAEAARVGADDYLTKPFQSIRQLVNKVTVLLNSQRGGVADARHLADTLEMDHPQMERASEMDTPVQFDDSGMDDEMIQTAQVSNYSLDESAKFETREPVEDPAKTQPLTSDEMRDFDFSGTPQESVGEEELQSSETEFEEESEAISTTETAEDEPESVADEAEYYARTDESEASQVYAEPEEHGVAEATEESEVSEITEAPTEESLAETEVAEVAETSEMAEESLAETEEAEESAEETAETAEEPVETVTETHEDAIPMPESASILEFDEGDFLELPPIEYEDEQEEEYEAESETETAAEPEAEPQEKPVGLMQSETTETLSPDLIEAIANRVMEKLSENAVKEVAWEVVPQMTELIVKKMAEEKLKE